MKTGQVILVGAGPGDPELMTLGGRKAIEEADVVVYDRLVGREILSWIPETAERIDVGKESSHHTVPQERISEILLEKALEGKRVVRLKGGDPFLFGRGGEELELLAEHGVPFREIPGVTSAIAVPAYAGIPVTHRDCCSSVHIVTGHQREGKPLSIAFDALVQTGGTLVFLMGVSALGAICRGLLDAGMDPQTPAAVVERGATPEQRVTLASLRDLPDEAARRQVKSPAVIVVGKVCAYAERFDWYDALPLKGKCVIVTRPKDRAGTLSDRLRALGARVEEMPCIETAPCDPCPELDEAIASIGDYAWLAFTSAAGVRTLMDYLDRTGRDVRALGGIRLAVVGPGTASELRANGLRADLVPAVSDGEHLGRALCEAEPRGKVLILRAVLGGEDLTRELERGGVPYTDVRCYKTRILTPDGQALRRLTEAGAVAAFTSASTVRGFAAALGEDADCSGVLAVCIGKQTEQEARRFGMRTITAREATLDALIERIVEGE